MSSDDFQYRAQISLNRALPSKIHIDLFYMTPSTVIGSPPILTPLALSEQERDNWLRAAGAPVNFGKLVSAVVSSCAEDRIALTLKVLQLSDMLSGELCKSKVSLLYDFGFIFFPIDLC